MLACAQCPVRDRAACSALNAGSRAELAAHGRVTKLERGDALFRAGDPSDRCATLIRGALKVVTTDADGTEHILALIHPAGSAEPAQWGGRSWATMSSLRNVDASCEADLTGEYNTVPGVAP